MTEGFCRQIKNCVKCHSLLFCQREDSNTSDYYTYSTNMTSSSEPPLVIRVPVTQERLPPGGEIAIFVGLMALGLLVWCGLVEVRGVFRQWNLNRKIQEEETPVTDGIVGAVTQSI